MVSDGKIHFESVTVLEIMFPYQESSVLFHKFIMLIRRGMNRWFEIMFLHEVTSVPFDMFVFLIRIDMNRLMDIQSLTRI